MLRSFPTKISLSAFIMIFLGGILTSGHPVLN